MTPVSNLVHLRPQLHHVDAVAHQERLAATNAAKDAASGPSGAASGAKAIHMTIKQGSDGNVVTTETMIDRLHAVQKEEWRRLKFTDENDEAAWEVYQESMILGGKEAAKRAAEAERAARLAALNDDEDEDGEDKGKGKEMVAEEAKMEVDIVEQVSKLSTTWGDDQLLEAVSGIVKPKVLTKEERKLLEEQEAAEAVAKAQAAAELEAKKAAGSRVARGGMAGRGRGAARGRGGASRGGAAPTAAMDLTK